MNFQKGSLTVAVLFFAVVWSAECATASGQQPYDADPDPNRPTLHVQPPLVPTTMPVSGRKAPASVINGITYIDVAVAAGRDFGGDDAGNEPAITANPLNPSQIVLTSFSGSNWFAGGNASLFYSGDGGATWTFTFSVPPPPGTTNAANCPCDQTMDWGRNGILYGTFLHVGGGVQTVFSAQTSNPADPSAWVYRAPGGVGQATNLPSLIYVDQPWIGSGPLPGDNGVTNVAVAYDNFDSTFSNSQIRAADSPGASPLDFTRDAPANSDFQPANDGMNPGNRIAVGPDGKIFVVYQRLVGTGAVKQLTYLINVSTDGGQTWSVANSDHVSGAKIIAADVFNFQGNGSKVGGVNALLGGVDSITVDKNGAAWVVYGARATQTSHDQLFLVKITYSAGSLTVGTPVTVSASNVDSYLPAVAVLPNGEVGVLFLTLNATLTFQWRFQQYTNGATLNKTTGFPTFTSPFSDNGNTRQRIFGDYVQARAVGCTYYGTYPAKGSGVNSATSIDPYFMSAPSQAPCTLPTLTSLVPASTCAGGPGLNVALKGTGFVNGATGRVSGVLRTTTFNGTTQVTTAVQAADIAAPGVATIDLLGAAPAGGLTGTLPFTIQAGPASPGESLRVDKSGSDVGLSWAVTLGATSYAVRRCNATLGPCSPTSIASPATNSYPDPVLADGNDYWYAVDAVNACGTVP
jgi:hypothetical protein